MSKRLRGLLSFTAAAIWPPLYDFLKSVLHDRIIHMIDPYVGMIPPEWVVKLGPSAALVALGLWLYFHTAKAKTPPIAGDDNSQKPKTVAEEFSFWFNRSTADRDRFMSEVENAYEIWRSGRNDRETMGPLNRIIDGARFPFPEPTNSEDIGKKVRRHQTSLSYAAGRLFLFCCSIYPRERPVTTSGIIDDERRELAKTFDDLGRKLFEFEVVSLADVSAMIRSQARLIKVLTFLEFAQAAQRDTPGPGKYGLFYLCSTLPE